MRDGGRAREVRTRKRQANCERNRMEHRLSLFGCTFCVGNSVDMDMGARVIID